MVDPASKTFQEQMKEIAFRASQRRILDIDLEAIEAEAVKLKALKNRLDFADTDFTVKIEGEASFFISTIRL